MHFNKCYLRNWLPVFWFNHVVFFSTNYNNSPWFSFDHRLRLRSYHSHEEADVSEHPEYKYMVMCTLLLHHLETPHRFRKRIDIEEEIHNLPLEIKKAKNYSFTTKFPSFSLISLEKSQS